MPNRKQLLAGAITCIALLSSCGSSQSVELAKDYYQHGLNDKAKEVLITVLHGAGTSPANRARSLYLLGQISFDERPRERCIKRLEILGSGVPWDKRGKGNQRPVKTAERNRGEAV